MFERRQIRELNEESRLTIIRKIETTPSPVKVSETSGANQELAFEEQKKAMLTALRSQPATGRLVIRISTDISEWENTPYDLQLRAGDSLFIPKQPGFVMVTGQVSNNTALIYTPGKSVGSYLKQAGGPTRSADTKKTLCDPGKRQSHRQRRWRDVPIGAGCSGIAGGYDRRA